MCAVSISTLKPRSLETHKLFLLLVAILRVFEQGLSLVELRVDQLLL